MNTMTNYVLAQYIEDIAVGDTEAVFPGSHEGLVEATQEREAILSQRGTLFENRALKIFKVIVEEL